MHFRETYDVFHPVMRWLFEKRVHAFISDGNDVLIEAALVRSLARSRERNRATE